MRIALVPLTGDAERALASTAEHYPGAEIVVVEKDSLRSGGVLAALRRLRELRPDRFVYLTRSNAWQLGRIRLLGFAALAGARRVVLADMEGASEEVSPARVALVEAPRALLELALALPLVAASAAATWAIGLAVARSRRTYARGSGVAPGVELGDSPGPEPDPGPSAGPAADGPDADPAAGSAGGRALSVLFLRPTPATGLVEGGESAHIVGVLDGLAALGHHPRVLSNSELPAVARAGHRVDVRPPGRAFASFRLAFELWNNVVFTLHAARAARRERPDFLYQRYSRNALCGVVAARAAGVPLLLEWNGSEAWVGRHWAGIWWFPLIALCERANVRGADAIVTVSRPLARALERDEGVDRSRLVVNPNAADPDRFRPGAGGPAVRAERGLDGAFVVGFAGAFNYYQGAPVLMRAAARVCAEVSHARFLVVGSGDALAPTREAAREGGVEDRVVFTGHLPAEDVPRHIDACDVAVAPMVPNPDGSEFFNSPVKLFEYMAAGRAIVASRLGQIADVIDDGETGLLVEPDDPAALAAAIVRLARDPELRARLGAAARSRALERHTWRANAERVVAAYERTASGRARSRMTVGR